MNLITSSTEALTARRRNLATRVKLPDLTEAEAYIVQAQVAAALGETVAGWKVAIVAGRPVAAPLFRSCLFSSAGYYRLQPATDTKIETELGFRLGRDLPSGPIDRDQLICAITSIHAAFEIVSPRAGEPPAIPFTGFLADNLGNAATVLGQGALLKTFPARGRLFSGEQLRVEGSHPHGDVLAGLLAFAALDRPVFGGLKCGQVIITGSFTGAIPVAESGTFTGKFDGLDPVEIAFEAARNGSWH